MSVHNEIRMIANAVASKNEKLSDIIDKIEAFMEKARDGKRLTKKMKAEFRDNVIKFYNINLKDGSHNRLPYDLVEEAFDCAVGKIDNCFFSLKSPELIYESETAMSTFFFGTLEFDVYGTKFEASVSWEDAWVTERSWDSGDDDEDDEDDDDEDEDDDDDDEDEDDDFEMWTEDSELCDVGYEELIQADDKK